MMHDETMDVSCTSAMYKATQSPSIACSHLTDAFAGEVGIAVKVILVKRVLNTDDGVLLAVAAVLLLQLRAGLDLLWVRSLGLEVQVVLAVLKELTGSYIHTNLDLAHIPSLLQAHMLSPATHSCMLTLLYWL